MKWRGPLSNTAPAITHRRPSLPARLTSLVCGFLVFVGSVLAGLYLTFPEQAVKARLVQAAEQQSGVRLSLAELDLKPVLALALRQVDVQTDHLPGFTLHIDELQLDPWWTSLLRGVPGIEGSAKLLGGTLALQAQASGRIASQAAGLQLDLPLKTLGSTRMLARLVNGQLHTAQPRDNKTETRLEAALEGLQFNNLGILDSLALGQIQLHVHGFGNSLKVEQLTASGGDIEARGSGTILLADRLENTRLDLTLAIRPSQAARPEVADLFLLAGPQRTDGSYQLRLRGTAAAPSLAPE